MSKNKKQGFETRAIHAGQLVQCRKRGAKNWGVGKKK